MLKISKPISGVSSCTGRQQTVINKYYKMSKLL